MVNHGIIMNVDEQMQERLENSFPLFDLIANEVMNTEGSEFGREIPPHWHRELEAFFLVHGQVQIAAGDSVFRLSAGEGCLINSGVLHSFVFQEGAAHFRSFLFDGSIVAGAPGSLFDTVYIRPFLKSGPAYLKFGSQSQDMAFFRAFEDIFRLCSEEPEGFELEARWGLSRIMLYAKQKSEVLPSRKIDTAQELRIKNMLSWMEEHLQDTLTVEDIARQGNICVRACQKAFQKYLHSSPIEYLQCRRIFAAARKLSATDEPITDIASGMGFPVQAIFQNALKKSLAAHRKDTEGRHRQSQRIVES